MKQRRYETYECDRCKFEYLRRILRKQKGLLLCKDCFDDVRENKTINMKLFGARSNATTVTAVTSPTIATITAAGGITPTNSISSDENIINYYLQVVGDGAVDIVADPQISASTNGKILTLEGTSNTNTVTLDNGSGLELTTSTYILKDGSVITLVYDSDKSAWVEVSRGNV